MKKLMLDLDALSVESFATAPEGTAPRGTVNAHLQQYQTFSPCFTGTLPPAPPNSDYCYSQGVCEPWTQNPTDQRCGG